MNEILRVKNEGATGASDYRFSIDEVAQFHGVSRNAVGDSREYSAKKIGEKERLEKKGKAYITDKLDKLYAYHLALKEDGVISMAGKGEDLKKNLEDETKYKITVQKVENASN